MTGNSGSAAWRSGEIVASKYEGVLGIELLCKIEMSDHWKYLILVLH